MKLEKVLRKTIMETVYLQSSALMRIIHVTITKLTVMNIFI